jgi:hypothetical protein
MFLCNDDRNALVTPGVAMHLSVRNSQFGRHLDPIFENFTTPVRAWTSILTDIPRMGVDLGPILPPSLPLGKADTVFEAERPAPRLASGPSRPEKSRYFDHENTLLQ